MQASLHAYHGYSRVADVYFPFRLSFSLTADRLAQLVERRTTVREVSGPRPDQHSES